MLTKKQRQKTKERLVEFLKYRVLHVDDSTHRIALGLALGVFVAFTPPLGHHILLVILLCSIFRANKFVGLTFIWLSNPFTYVVLYYPNYLLGRGVLAFFGTAGEVEPARISAMFDESLSFDHVMTSFYTSEFWRELGSFFVKIGFEMFTGGLIIGSIVAGLAYFMGYRLIDGYRRRHPHHFPDHI
ncbi:MAG: DUF2062 domain-containing protein [Deltaproteobacteria bacterium]|nr:DUF2062 domain-containing protein [Deltaproteobacteria bacterium]